MLRFITAVALFLYFTPLISQDINVETNRNLYLGIQTGTDALLGAEVLLEYGGKNTFSGGLFFHDFNLKGLKYRFKSDDVRLNIDAGISMSFLQFRYDRKIYGDIIYLSAGAAVFYKNQFKLKIESDEPITINDLDASPEEIGHVIGIVRWDNKISPFMGLGIGSRKSSKKTWFSANAGVYFKGIPRFDMTATNLLRSNELNEDLIEEKLSFFKFIPYLNFAIHRKI